MEVDGKGRKTQNNKTVRATVNSRGDKNRAVC